MKMEVYTSATGHIVVANERHAFAWTKKEAEKVMNAIKRRITPRIKKVK